MCSIYLTIFVVARIPVIKILQDIHVQIILRVITEVIAEVLHQDDALTVVLAEEIALRVTILIGSIQWNPAIALQVEVHPHMIAAAHCHADVMT